MFGDVSVVPGFLAQGLGPLAYRYATTGFSQEESDYDDERDVGQTLDTFDPSPADILVDKAGIDGGANGAQDGDVGESRHGNGSLLGNEHVIEGTTDQDGTDTTKKTQQSTTDDDGGDVLTQRKTDEHDTEQNIPAGIDNPSAGQFAERSEEQRSHGAGLVEGEQTQLAEFVGDAEFSYHFAHPGVIGGCGETDEERHETEEHGDKPLVADVPVEGVFSVSGGVIEHDVVSVVMVNDFRPGQGHVDGDLLQRSPLDLSGFILLEVLQVFASGNAALHAGFRGGIVPT